MSYQIIIKKTTTPKAKPNPDELGFGKYFTDHMFIMDYKEGKGWHDARIVSYAPLEMDPSTVVFHYGQAVFEGMKAYKTKDGRVLLFRPEKNIERLNISNDRVCIPQIDVDFAINALKQLIEVEKDWVPENEGTSLYIRPFVISTEAFLGVRPSLEYKFIIILSPVGAYYKEGMNPVKIFVEPEYVRAVKGGIGNAKIPGNYAASLKAQLNATKMGYSQVLWLDAIERKYVEEVGTMNVFFKINDEVITPSLEGSILPGVTRDSTIKLLKHLNIKVVERKISIEEIFQAHIDGSLKEVFGTGTAAVISPVGELNWNGKGIVINNGEIGEISQMIYDKITGIQTGKIEDTFKWTVEV